jgi:gluconate 5-dehydrogenase
MDVLDRPAARLPGGFDLTGRVALVAGGGGAIGSALAAGLADLGARVVTADRAGDLARAAAERIAATGHEALGLEADLIQPDEAERVVARALAAFGRLDIHVNAIGGGAGKVIFDAERYPLEAWDWILDLNLRSTLVATQPAVRSMIDGGRGGRVLNISSVRAQLGINTGYSAYVAAKGAVSSLTRQWAVEWARHGITVNAIAPTFVDTPQVAMLLGDPAFKSALVARVPLGRVGQTGDLVGAAQYLCSDAASFVTGQILTIDGGLTATQ